MMERDQEDRLRRAFSVPTSDARPIDGCPGDEEIWAASRGDGAPDRVQELLRHSLACPSCAQSWEAAAALGEEATPSTAVVPLRPRRRSILYGLAAAAALLLPTIAVILMLDRAPRPLPPIEDLGPAAIPPLAERVRADLWRVEPEEDQVLQDGGEVRPGDRLYLTLYSEEPVHLYVVNRDAEGEAAVLFPIADAQWKNPLTGGTSHRLPGDTDWAYDSWEVSSAGGRESFIVVASLEPLPEMEAALARMESASPLDPGGVLRGGKPSDPGSATSPDAGLAALDAALERLALGHRTDVVVREITLQNPR